MVYLCNYTIYQFIGILIIKKNLNLILKKFPNSENYYSTAFSIPIYFLNKKKQFKIVNLINSFFKNKISDKKKCIYIK